MFATSPFRPRTNGGAQIGAQSLGKPAASFPAILATDQKLAIAVDRLQTTLALALDSVSTTMTVADASHIVPYVLLSIDNEIMQVTGAPAGNQVPISRGFDGTIAAVHLLNALVSGFVDAYHHNTLVGEVEAIENALGPNLSRIPSSPLVVSNAFQFAPQSPGGSLVVGNNSITMAPVPAGVNGTDANHYLYVSGGTGAAEAVLITGGSAVAGAPSGTLIINCANAHSGAWTIQTATSGIQEAIISLGPVTSSFITTGTGGGLIWIPVGTHDLYAPITLTSNITLYGANVKSAIVRSNGTNMIRTLGSGLTGCVGCGVENLAFDLNLFNINGLDLYGCQSGVFRNLYFYRGNGSTGTGINLHGSPPPGPDYCSDCLFDHIHMEQGPQRCLALQRATLCTFRHLRLACDTGPVIDLIAATDTNYFYDVDIASGSASQGIYFNSSNTPPDADYGVGSFHFHNVIVEGSNPGTAILLGNTQDIHIENLGGTWGSPFAFDIVNAKGCRITNIFGFGLTQRINEWSSDGLIIGTPSSPSFIAFNRFAPSLANGPNHNINIANAAWIPLTGLTAAFSITGFTGGVAGRVLYVLNESLQTMTISNQNAGSIATNQIITLTGADVTLRAGRSFAQFIYDNILQAWILMSTN
jgi:hypothetical protein